MAPCQREFVHSFPLNVKISMKILMEQRLHLPSDLFLLYSLILVYRLDHLVPSSHFPISILIYPLSFIRVSRQVSNNFYLQNSV